MKLSKILTSLLLGSSLLLTGCGDSDDNQVEATKVTNSTQNVEDEKSTPTVQDKVTEKTFEVTVINLTSGQPFSPVAVLSHNETYSLYTMGATVSTAMEKLAEGGDNSEVLTTVTRSASGAGLIVPGASESISITIEDETQLSIASMLVQTNDTFLTYKNIDVSKLGNL